VVLDSDDDGLFCIESNIGNTGGKEGGGSGDSTFDVIFGSKTDGAT